MNNVVNKPNTGGHEKLNHHKIGRFEEKAPSWNHFRDVI